MKTIFFHIGQTKTATTTLQAFFYENRQWLANNGVYYPPCPEGHPLKTQHRFLVESLRGVQLPIPPDLPAWKYLKDVIEKAPEEKILISEEVFWHVFENRPEEKSGVIEWIKNQFADYDVKVICYLRRQDRWIESWYNQITKTDVNELSKQDYMAFIDHYRANGLLDYHRTLRLWGGAFGDANLVIRPFEKNALLDGDIIADFLDILGLRYGAMLVRPKDLQVSLCNSACELSSIFNKTRRAAAFKHKFRKILAEYDSEVVDKRRFTPKEVALGLIAEYSQSNALLAKEFGGKDCQFFDTDELGYEFGEYEGISTEELAAFVMHLFQDIQGQIRSLRTKVDELESASSKTP